MERTDEQTPLMVDTRTDTGGGEVGGAGRGEGEGGIEGWTFSERVDGFRDRREQRRESEQQQQQQQQPKVTLLCTKYTQAFVFIDF